MFFDAHAGYGVSCHAKRTARANVLLMQRKGPTSMQSPSQLCASGRSSEAMLRWRMTPFRQAQGMLFSSVAVAFMKGSSKMYFESASGMFSSAALQIC